MASAVRLARTAERYRIWSAHVGYLRFASAGGASYDARPVIEALVPEGDDSDARPVIEALAPEGDSDARPVIEALVPEGDKYGE